MNRVVMKLSTCIALLLLISLLSQPVFAGKLDDFEQDMTEEKKEEEKTPPRHYDDDYDDCGFWACIFRAFFRGVFRGSSHDDNRDDHRHLRQERRRSDYEFSLPRNHVLFPSFRFDGGYQNVESDVRAFDARVELGYSFLAGQGRLTYYNEEDPSDELWLGYLHGLLRLPLGDHIELGAGVGAAILDGENRNGGFSMTSPILIYPTNSVGVEFRPTWSWINENSLDDYELGVVFGSPYASVRAGYRWVRGERVSLDGPFLGCSFRF